MDMGHDSKLTYEEAGERLLIERHELWQRMADPSTGSGQAGDYSTSSTHTAVVAHLHAALHALREHDCESVARHIEEALELL